MSKARDDMDFSLDTEFGEKLLHMLKARRRHMERDGRGQAPAVQKSCEELDDDDLDWVSAAGDPAAEYAREMSRKDQGGPGGRHQH